MEQHAVIDETFAGLARPTQTFELGRQDIEEERPGAALVAAVQEFEAADGFKKIAADREAARVADEAKDAAVTKTKANTTDFGIVSKDSQDNDAKADAK